MEIKKLNKIYLWIKNKYELLNWISSYHKSRIIRFSTFNMMILLYLIIGIIIFFCLALFLTFFTSYIKKQFEYNTDYNTCTPIGIYSKYKFDSNPNEFYYNEISSFKEYINYWDNNSIKVHCISSTNENECIKNMAKLKQDMTKCLNLYNMRIKKRD